MILQTESHGRESAVYCKDLLQVSGVNYTQIFESSVRVGADVSPTALLGCEDEMDLACVLRVTGINTHTPDLSRSVSVITARTVCHISGTHAHGDSFL